MKKRPLREILLLLVPVLFLGGLAVFRPLISARELLLGEPKDLREGPMRLEIASVKPFELTPLEVAQGWRMGIEIEAWQKGALDVGNAKQTSIAVNFFGRTKLEYGDGTSWRVAPERAFPLHQIQSSLQDQNDVDALRFKRHQRVLLRLDGVPNDTKAIRLRGDLMSFNSFRANTCGRFVGQSGWTHYPRGHCDLNFSTPFQIALKKPEDRFPTPLVSRETLVEPIHLELIGTDKSAMFYLQARHKTNANWREKPGFAVVDLKIVDRHGAPVEFFYGTGANVWKRDLRFAGGTFLDKESFAQKLPPSDIVIPLVSSLYRPKKGFLSLRYPLSVSGKVSDGKCWPTPFSFRVSLAGSAQSKLGAF